VPFAIRVVSFAARIEEEDATMTQRERPLSPHLQVYRWQITMTMSILHRATGVALAIGAFGVAWWLLAVAGGAESHATFQAFSASWFGRIALFGLSFCLVYHLLNGLRHLLWDVGYGYEIPKLYATGWTVVALSVLITGAVWFCALRAGGLA
jgi:succinate dehydrogenase / fumarate reductase cytochrome b subunit